MKKNVYVIVFLILIIIGLCCYIVYDNYVVSNKLSDYELEVEKLKEQLQILNDNVNDTDSFSVSLVDLYGTYNWKKNYTNNYGDQINLSVKLVLNSDGTATYYAGDGMAYEATKGTFQYKDNQIIYTREYFNYDGQDNDLYNGNDNKILVFNVIDKNTLQHKYHNQTTELKK